MAKSDSRLNVVLHRPVYARNVGMCARAIANMGAGRLIIVDPQKTLDERARQGAAHAQDILSSATIYPDLASFEAAEGEGLRLALSGRAGVAEPVGLDEAIESFKRDPDHIFHAPDLPIYLFFGTESDGLSNEEMRLCHNVCRLPTYGAMTSMNLSHAVMLALYIVRSRMTADSAVAAAEPTFYPSDMIRTWLNELGFEFSHKKVNIESKLNRIILSRAPRAEELRLLETVIQQTIRRLRMTKK